MKNKVLTAVTAVIVVGVCIAEWKHIGKFDLGFIGYVTGAITGYVLGRI